MGEEAKVHNKHAGTAPRGAVYVGRGSPWGNPFRIGMDGDRATVIRKFEETTLPTLDLRPLRGKHLICFCAPDAALADAGVTVEQNWAALCTRRSHLVGSGDDDQ